VYHDPVVGYWALSRYADVTAAARNFTDFSSAHGAGMSKRKGETMLASDPPNHTRLRKLVSHAFKPGVIEALAPRINAICHELIDSSAVARGCFELVDDFAAPLPVIVIADLLGFDPARRDDYRRWSRALIEVFSNPDSLQAQWNYRRTGPEFFAYLAEVGQARMRSPRDDLISLLIQAREERDALSMNEIAFSSELFLAAGNETTTSLIGNAALALAANPGEAKQVINKAPTADVDALSILQQHFRRSARQRIDFGDRIQIDEYGSRHAKEARGVEAIFQFVQRGIHPVLPALADQTAESVFGLKAENLSLAHHQVVGSILHQGPGRSSPRASNDLIDGCFPGA